MAGAVLRLTGAVTTSALAGVLAAAVALPVVAGAGVAVREGAKEYLVLPADLDDPTLGRRTRILAADGTTIAWLFRENRVPVPLAAVPEHVRQAVVAIEDSRFYEHDGVDPMGVLRALIHNVRSGDVQQGASTLTQQYVKNARVVGARTDAEREEATEVSFPRKLQEARYALGLERRLSKDEILQRYLNIAYFGNGAYGVAAAATTYFSRPLADLSLAQGALLAGIVQSPTRHDPVRHPDVALGRRDLVLQRMADEGSITEQERVAATAEPLGLKVSRVGSGCEAPGVVAPFFCDYVRRSLEDGPLGRALGSTREARQDRLLDGGLTVRTTLDLRVQRVADAVLTEQVPPTDPSGVAATFTAVEPGTGSVVALAVNRAFAEDDGPGRTKLNLPLGGSSGMQVGSAFKPFVLAAALEQGLPLTTTFFAPDRYTSRVFRNCDGRTCDEPYEVRNAGDSASGVHDLVSGTRNSVNTFYLQLLERTGVEEPAQIAERFGLRQFENGAPSKPLHRGGSLVLGVNEVSPLAMSAAYAGFAARGLYCPPRPVSEVLDEAGRPLPLPEQECVRALPATTVDTMASVLRGVIDGPWSRTARTASIGRPAAGKTGTTNGSKAAWFVGWTPQLAAAVWVGKPKPQPLQRITINGRYYRQVYGGSLPAPIWSKVMSQAMRGLPAVDLPPAAVSAPTGVRPPDDDETT